MCLADRWSDGQVEPFFASAIFRGRRLASSSTLWTGDGGVG